METELEESRRPCLCARRAGDGAAGVTDEVADSGGGNGGGRDDGDGGDEGLVGAMTRRYFWCGAILVAFALFVTGVTNGLHAWLAHELHGQLKGVAVALTGIVVMVTALSYKTIVLLAPDPPPITRRD